MDFATWEPVYEAILADFGYDRSADEIARDVLGELATSFDLALLGTITDATVAIAGGAPSLADELAVAHEADAVVAVSTASKVLLEAGLAIDCVVTDLDKTPGTVRDLTHEGVPAAVHAHGDNLAGIREWVPQFDRMHVLATTQAEPAPSVENFGGFTDGDRAAFLADHVGARRLVFPGWDLDDATVSDEKRRKLRWAERLLYWLEERRGERFAVLDGRRGAIDTDALPM